MIPIGAQHMRVVLTALLPRFLDSFTIGFFWLPAKIRWPSFKAFGSEDHPHHDLHAVVTFMFVLTAFCFGAARTDLGKMPVRKVIG